MNKFGKMFLSAAVLAIFATVSVGCIEKTENGKNSTVVAKVDGEKITMGELNEKMKSTLEQFKTNYGDTYASDTDVLSQVKAYYQTSLDTLIEEKVLLKQAQELNMVPDQNKIDEEIQKEMDSIKKNYYNDNEEEFKAGLESFGYTVDSLKENIKTQIVENPNEVAVNRVKEYLIGQQTVTEEEVKAYYDENGSSYKTTPGANVAHILVKTEDEAKAVKARLAKGENFEALAKELSIDPGSASTGGSYGFIEYSNTDYVEEFMNAIKSQSEGQISDPVKSDYGYHIIRTTGVIKEATQKPYEEVKAEIKDLMQSNKEKDVYNEKLDALKEQYKVKKYEDKIDDNMILI